MTTSAGRAQGHRHLTLGVACLLSDISRVDRIAVHTFLPPIPTDLGLTAVQVGQPRNGT